jgi:hypothetical protein
VGVSTLRTLFENALFDEPLPLPGPTSLPTPASYAPSAFAIVSPIVAGDSTTWIPAALSASNFSAAVPSPGQGASVFLEAAPPVLTRRRESV